MPMKRAGRIFLGLVTGFFLVVPFCLCLSAEPENEKEGNLNAESSFYLEYMPSRAAEAMPGKIAIVESGTESSYEFKAGGSLPVEISLDTGYIGIEDTLVDLELPSHLTSVIFGIETTSPFFDFSETYLRFGIRPSFYGDDWNFSAAAFRLPVHSFFIRRVNPKLLVLAGLAVYPDFENEVLPILGFIYKPNDRLSFNIVPKNPNIDYVINERLSVFAEGKSAFNSEFEVARAAEKNVVLRYRRTRLGGGIRVKLGPYAEVAAQAGGVFNRYLKYRDGQGKVSIKDGVYTEVRVDIRL